MNVINIHLGLPIVISGILGLYAFTASSQTERQWRYRLVIPAWAIFFLATCVSFYENVYSIDFEFYFIAFAVLWPLIIAFFINQKAIEYPIGVSKTNYLLFGGALVFIVLMTTLALLPDRISIPDRKPIIDNEYISSRISLMLEFIAFAVWFILLAYKATVFHRNGIFHMGFLWAWSDLESYRWEDDDIKNKNFILRMKTKGVWFHKQLKFKIASEQKYPIDSLLAEELGSGTG